MVEVIHGTMWYVFGTDHDAEPSVKQLDGSAEFPSAELSGTVHEINLTVKSYADDPVCYFLGVWGLDRDRAVARWYHVRSRLGTADWWTDLP